MRFGTAKEIITPTKPVRLACCGDFERPFNAVHDDVYARALALEEAGEKIVLMTFDLLFHDRSLNDALEEYAQAVHGVRPGGLLIAYTHAHTAPAVKGYNPGAHDGEYEAFLLERARGCLDRALCAMVPGTLEWGCFEADYNISRRGFVDGRYTIAPNFHYEHDRQFSVLCVRDGEGRVRSVFMNYACHPVFYPGRDEGVLSGEFPARLCQYIDAEYEGCVSLFSQSAAGDVRPRPTAQPAEGGGYKFRPMDFAALDSFASGIARDVAAFIGGKNCAPVAAIPWACAAFRVDLPLVPAGEEYFRAMAEEYKDSVGPLNPLKNNSEYISDGRYDELPEELPLHCQLIRLSDRHYIAAMGGEPCFGVKRAVLEALEGCRVIFVGYTDACAYLVDDTVLAEGGYEPESFLEYRLKGPLKPGVTALYTEAFADARAALTVLRRLGLHG